ncbi:hypothetical protein CSKR_107290 [Clonorchis sinensis]|uniref:Uncharacterized protein n=1 Tax=Clonorchis sinensis TaxID=79923 RepID=A0A419Q2U0_CLOSI|nr:hypothetical protein CSKR_107290 [Clonorchis sinensis]
MEPGYKPTRLPGGSSDGGGGDDGVRKMQIRYEKRKPSSEEIQSFANQFGFCERLTWNPAESPVCGVFRQLNVLHQTASCSSCYDIRDIAIHNIKLAETRGLRLPDEPQEGRNRSWAVEEFKSLRSESIKWITPGLITK